MQNRLIKLCLTVALGTAVAACQGPAQRVTMVDTGTGTSQKVSAKTDDATGITKPTITAPATSTAVDTSKKTDDSTKNTATITTTTNTAATTTTTTNTAATTTATTGTTTTTTTATTTSTATNNTATTNPAPQLKLYLRDSASEDRQALDVDLAAGETGAISNVQVVRHTVLVDQAQYSLAGAGAVIELPAAEDISVTFQYNGVNCSLDDSLGDGATDDAAKSTCDGT